MDGNIYECFSHGELVLIFNMNCHLYEVFASVHTTPEKFENVTLLLRLSLPSTLFVTKTEIFENALQTGGI